MRGEDDLTLRDWTLLDQSRALSIAVAILLNHPLRTFKIIDCSAQDGRVFASHPDQYVAATMQNPTNSAARMAMIDHRLIVRSEILAAQFALIFLNLQ